MSGRVEQTSCPAETPFPYQSSVSVFLSRWWAQAGWIEVLLFLIRIAAFPPAGEERSLMHEGIGHLKHAYSLWKGSTDISHHLVNRAMNVATSYSSSRCCFCCTTKDFPAHVQQAGLEEAKETYCTSRFSANLGFIMQGCLIILFTLTIFPNDKTVSWRRLALACR